MVKIKSSKEKENDFPKLMHCKTALGEFIILAIAKSKEGFKGTLLVSPEDKNIGIYGDRFHAHYKDYNKKLTIKNK